MPAANQNETSAHFEWRLRPWKSPSQWRQWTRQDWSDGGPIRSRQAGRYGHELYQRVNVQKLRPRGLWGVSATHVSTDVLLTSKTHKYTLTQQHTHYQKQIARIRWKVRDRCTWFKHLTHWCCCFLTPSICLSVSISYVEKFTDFLRLFVSVHLRRIESNAQFPLVEFLALLFKYTFNQVKLFHLMFLEAPTLTHHIHVSWYFLFRYFDY